VRPGITEQEAIMLQTLVRLKGASAARLAKQMGVSLKTVRSRIARLAALGYVADDGTEGNSYRAVERANGH
jgi:predicted HTH transcriptional regulator